MALVRLLTWNIWMMPEWTGQSPKNASRARAIGRLLARSEFDVVCLQKAFDDCARSVIVEEAGAVFRYRYGPVNPGTCFSISSGVWVLSRAALHNCRTIEYRDKKDFDAFSRKGAVLLDGAAGGRPFQIVATHLQGESYQDVRNLQMAQLQVQLLSQARRDLPLFICGDLGTPRRCGIGSLFECADYLNMLKLFGAENGPGDRVTLDDRRDHNDLAMDNTGRRAELDYILVRPGTAPTSGAWERLVLRHHGWDGPGGRRDLSYRYAVAAAFRF